MRHTQLLSPKHISRAFAPCRIALLLACIALAAGVLVAQTFFGSIVGTITDSSRASVAGATVALTKTGTGGLQASTSGANANYPVGDLITGLRSIDSQS